MGLSEVELDLFTTLARIIPSLCPLGITTTLPRPDQLQGDLVGTEEVPTPEIRETDREKAVSLTSNGGAAWVFQVPSSFSRSRSATPAFSHEASPCPGKTQVATEGATMTNSFCSNTTTRTILQYVPTLLSRRQDAEGLKHLQNIFKQHAAPSATGSGPSAGNPVEGQHTSPQGTPTKRQNMSVTPCPWDPKTWQVVKTLVASTGYELASGSTLHQLHDVTAQDNPEVIQDPDEDIDLGKDDNVDDDITYLGTSQPGELLTGTNTTPVLKSKKKKPTEPKTEDKAEEVALREKRKADHEMAHRILYADDFLAIQTLHQRLNLPRAGDPNMDMSSELKFMDQEWWKTHPDSFFCTHIYTVEEVTKHLEECAGNVKKYSAMEHGKYQAALTTLATQSMWVPFQKPSRVHGTRDILITRLAFAMVNESGRYSNCLTRDEYRREMVGLVTLHKCAAIYLQQVNNVSGCYCPFCSYVGAHHIALNNHICSHWHLGLLCSYPGCFQAHVEVDTMLAHMLGKYGMKPYGRN